MRRICECVGERNDIWLIVRQEKSGNKYFLWGLRGRQADVFLSVRVLFLGAREMEACC